ncbi:MAG: antibiotic biosynthesis monooxygenase [Hyphomicrobiales bacterium]|nr:antibiotic biosynthesis monooxygenase [Hyphomicrobiales bacterium]
MRSTRHDIRLSRGIGYECYRADEPGIYILIERWADREAIQVHFKSPHMAELLPKLAPYAVE